MPDDTRHEAAVEVGLAKLRKAIQRDTSLEDDFREAVAAYNAALGGEAEGDEAKESRERFELIQRFAKALANPECDADCEGTGIDVEGSEWTLCECVQSKLERVEAGEVSLALSEPRQDQPVDRAAGERPAYECDCGHAAGVHDGMYTSGKRLPGFERKPTPCGLCSCIDFQGGAEDPTEHPETGEREERGGFAIQYAIQRAVYAAVHHERRHGMEKHPALLAGRVTDILAGRTPVGVEDEPPRDAFAQPDNISPEPLQDGGEREALRIAQEQRATTDVSKIPSPYKAFEEGWLARSELAYRRPHQDVEPLRRDADALTAMAAEVRLVERVETAEAAVERLREALQRIADGGPGVNVSPMEFARSALASPDDRGGER